MTTFAGQWGPEIIIGTGGGAQPQAQMTIYEIDGVTLATVYADRDRTPVDNPLPIGVATGSAGTDIVGNATFWAEPDVYVQELRIGGKLLYRSPISCPPDPTEQGGIVESVVAGTNVTVDDTDPRNPIVSSTGGGGDVVSVVGGDNIAVDDTDPANPVVSVATDPTFVSTDGTASAQISDDADVGIQLLQTDANTTSALNLHGGAEVRFADPSDASRITSDFSATSGEAALTHSPDGGATTFKVSANDSGIALTGPVIARDPEADDQVDTQGARDAAIAAAPFAPLASPTFTGTVTVPTPTAPTAAANKTYVDQLVNGLTWKAEVSAATTAALATNTYNNGASGVGATLTATADAALVIDGYTTHVGDRVLVKNEATTTNNGIYTVTAIGSGSAVWVLTRTTDFDSPTTIAAGDVVFVVNGTTNATTSWGQTTAGTITVGTSPIVFAQVSGPGSYTPGSGISITATVIAADATVARLASPAFTGTPTVPDPTGATGILNRETGDGRYVMPSRQVITTGGALTGGGPLTADLTLDLGANEVDYTKLAAFPYFFGIGATDQNIPGSQWTPVAFTRATQADVGGIHPINSSTTTIAAGSNTATLPQGTIHVASTAGFPAATTGIPRCAAVTISGVLVVFSYTGTSGGNAFTGCTLGVGTLATGQTVIPANEFFYTPTIGNYAATSEMHWAPSPVGRRKILWRAMDGVFNLPAYRSSTTATNEPAPDYQALQISGMPTPPPPPASWGPSPLRIEVYQDSPVSLLLKQDGIMAPTMSEAYMNQYQVV